MKTKRIIALVLVIAVLGILLCSCGEENKYVNVGVEMSTAGLSLYLTNTANNLEKISTYVYFSQSPEASIEKISHDKQGIDITYLPAEKLGLITKDKNLTVVFVDCFTEDGDLMGVWVARNGWLKDAPNYSYRYIRGLVKCTDYRLENAGMTYEEALKSVEGLRDFDFSVFTDPLQYCAIYSVSNKETLVDSAFGITDSKGLLERFKGFADKTGSGYTLCRNAYEKYCTGDDVKSFEDMFDFTLMLRAIDEVNTPKE